MSDQDRLRVSETLRLAGISSAWAVDELARAFTHASNASNLIMQGFTLCGVLITNDPIDIRPYNHPKERRRRQIVNALNRVKP